MSNPTLKLGVKGDYSNSIYRDNADNDKTIIKNNNVDILKICGVTTENTIEVIDENTVLDMMSSITGVTSSTSINMGILGGDSWSISSGIPSNSDPGYNFHIRKNSTEHLTILNSGNIGVGIANPSQTLTVDGNTTLTTGNDYQINDTSVLNATTLGSDVVNSSLTNVGTLTTLDISGDFTVDTNTLYVDSANNRVGINTINPSTDLDINGDVLVQGKLTVNGDTVSFNTETVTVQDPLMKLANNNSGDTLDIGHYGLYNDGTTKYTGLFRDATDGVYKFFTGTTVEPTTTVDTTSANGYSSANVLVDNLEASTLNITNTAQFTNEVSLSTMTATGLVQVNSLGVTTNATITGNATIIGTVDSTGNINTDGVYKVDDVEVLNGTTLGSGVVNSYLTSNTGNLTNTGTLDLTTGNDFQINSVSVLNATTLGTAVANSSLTSIGTLTSLTVSGDSSLATMSTTGLSQVNSLGVTTNATITGTLDSTGNINTDGVYKVDDTEVLNGTTLGSAVVNSSLTSVGTLTSLTVSGDFTVDTNSLYIDSTNNKVGIGNVAPVGKLHIEDDTDNQADETATHGMIITSGTSGQSLMIGYDGDDDMSYINSGKTGSVTNLTLQTRGGFVGVGITNPSYEFDVNGDINLTGVIYQNGVTLDAGNWAASGSDIYNVNSGNIGIGVTDPTSIIDINTASSTNGTNAIRFNNFDAGPRFVLWDGGVDNNDYAGLGKTSSALDISIPATTDHFRFMANGNELMTILGTGNVGIDSVAPSALLSLGVTLANTKFAIFDSGFGATFGMGVQPNEFGFNLAVTANKYTFYDTPEWDNDLLTILGSGNIGINIATPETKLQIDEAGGTDNKQLIISAGTVTGHDSGIEIRGSRAGSNAVDQASLLFTNFDSDLASSNPLGQISGRVSNVSTNIGDMVFYTFDTGVTKTEAMRITDSGNIGIGIATPSEKLHIVDGNIFIQKTTANSDAVFRIKGTQGTDREWQIRIGIGGGESIWRIYDATGGVDRGQITTNGQQLMYQNDTTSTVPAMIVRKSVNNTSDNRFINFSHNSTSINDPGTSAGGIRLASGSLVIDGTSDRKLKENIVSYDNGDVIVRALEARIFDWKGDDKPNNIKGFIAQEVREVLPESVFDNEDTGILTMTRNDMIPVMWSALRKAFNKIDKLEEEIAILKS